jgi:prevent-host-death family protein
VRTINASDFKARCLAILDEVARTGEPITILKRGKPVARLVTAGGTADEYPQRTLAGTVRIHGDIIGPVLPALAWEAEAEPR